MYQPHLMESTTFYIVAAVIIIIGVWWVSSGCKKRDKYKGCTTRECHNAITAVFPRECVAKCAEMANGCRMYAYSKTDFDQCIYKEQVCLNTCPGPVLCVECGEYPGEGPKSCSCGNGLWTDCTTGACA